MLRFADDQIIECANGPFYARNDGGIPVDRNDVPIENIDPEITKGLLLMPAHIDGYAASVFEDVVI